MEVGDIRLTYHGDKLYFVVQRRIKGNIKIEEVPEYLWRHDRTLTQSYIVFHVL